MRLLQVMFSLPVALFALNVAVAIEFYLSEDLSPRIDAPGMLASSLALLSGYGLFLAWALAALRKVKDNGQVRALLLKCPIVGALAISLANLIPGLSTGAIRLESDNFAVLAMYFLVFTAFGYGYSVVVGVSLAMAHLFHWPRDAP